MEAEVQVSVCPHPSTPVTVNSMSVAFISSRRFFKNAATSAGVVNGPKPPASVPPLT